ncbi:MAG: serine/threonine-protein kinase [Pseudomonadota bacterium]
MENLKSALAAFLINELKYKDLLDKLEQTLEQTPDACEQLLSYLTNLHKINRLPQEVYVALKLQIEQFEQNTGVKYADMSNPSIRTSQSSWTNLPENGEEGIIKPGVIIRENYRLIEPIGKGSMGVVWKAIDLVQEAGDSRTPYVAIKFLNRKFKPDSDAFKALVREFARYRKLNHPNIVRAYELSRLGGTVFMVMEFLEGISLRQLIKSYPLGVPFEEAKHIIQGMVHALSYAHNDGIAHLDFKPANVYYDAEHKQAKVIDFGIARLIKQSGQEETQSYTSCETFLGLDHPAPADDIYALACMTYELLSGKHPFGRKTSPEAESENLSPTAINVLNRQQNKALERALAFRWEKRTKTVDEFLAELFPEKKKRSGLALGVVITIVLQFGLLGGFALDHLKSIEATTLDKKRKAEDLVLEDIKRQQEEALRRFEEQKREEEKARQAKVARKLQKCQEYFDTQPSGEKTQVCYQKVSELDPANSEALDGLKAVKINRVAKLLPQCQEHFDALRLTTGSGGTALVCYQEVLKLDLENSEALVGLTAIEDRYVGWIKRAFSRKRLDKAETYLIRLERVNPELPELDDLKWSLAQEREKAQGRPSRRKRTRSKGRS